MTQSRVTTADVMAAVHALAKAIADKPDNDCSHQLALLQKEINGQLEQIRQDLKERALTCPYRDEVRRASNNVARFQSLEDRLKVVEIAQIKAGLLPGAAGGTVGTILAGAMILLGKALGWW